MSLSKKYWQHDTCHNCQNICVITNKVVTTCYHLRNRLNM